MFPYVAKPQFQDFILMQYCYGLREQFLLSNLWEQPSYAGCLHSKLKLLSEETDDLKYFFLFSAEDWTPGFTRCKHSLYQLCSSLNYL